MRPASTHNSRFQSMAWHSNPNRFPDPALRQVYTPPHVAAAAAAAAAAATTAAQSVPKPGITPPVTSETAHTYSKAMLLHIYSSLFRNGPVPEGLLVPDSSFVRAHDHVWSTAHLEPVSNTPPEDTEASLIASGHIHPDHTTLRKPTVPNGRVPSNRYSGNASDYSGKNNGASNYHPTGSSSSRLSNHPTTINTSSGGIASEDHPSMSPGSSHPTTAISAFPMSASSPSFSARGNDPGTTLESSLWKPHSFSSPVSATPRNEPRTSEHASSSTNAWGASVRSSMLSSENPGGMVTSMGTEPSLPDPMHTDRAIDPSTTFPLYSSASGDHAAKGSPSYFFMHALPPQQPPHAPAPQPVQSTSHPMSAHVHMSPSIAAYRPTAHAPPVSSVEAPVVHAPPVLPHDPSPTPTIVETFRAELWFYRDPIGMVQGPFASDVMQEWYMLSFFTSDLPIQATFRGQHTGQLVSSGDFLPLLHFIIKYCQDRTAPFLNASFTTSVPTTSNTTVSTPAPLTAWSQPAEPDTTAVYPSTNSATSFFNYAFNSDPATTLQEASAVDAPTSVHASASVYPESNAENTVKSVSPHRNRPWTPAVPAERPTSPKPDLLPAKPALAPQPLQTEQSTTAELNLDETPASPSTVYVSEAHVSSSCKLPSPPPAASTKKDKTGGKDIKKATTSVKEKMNKEKKGVAAESNSAQDDVIVLEPQPSLSAWMNTSDPEVAEVWDYVPPAPTAIVAAPATATRAASTTTPGVISGKPTKRAPWSNMHVPKPNMTQLIQQATSKSSAAAAADAAKAAKALQMEVQQLQQQQQQQQLSHSKMHAKMAPGAAWNSAASMALQPSSASSSLSKLSREATTASRAGASVQKQQSLLPPAPSAVQTPAKTASRVAAVSAKPSTPASAQPVSPQRARTAAAAAAAPSSAGKKVTKAAVPPGASLAADSKGANTVVKSKAPSKKSGGAPAATTPAASAAAAVHRTAVQPLSDDLSKWTRHQLKSLPGIQSHELMSLFAEFPVDDAHVKETQLTMATMVLDFSTSLDGRAFAAEFTRRRRADLGLNASVSPGFQMVGNATRKKKAATKLKVTGKLA